MSNNQNNNHNCSNDFNHDYNHDYNHDHNQDCQRVKESLPARIIQGLGAGLAGLVLLPTLSILSFTFVVVGLALPALSVLNLTGITDIPFNVLFFRVRGIPQLLIALLTGGGFLAAGAACYSGLKRFLKSVRGRAYR